MFRRVKAHPITDQQNRIVGAMCAPPDWITYPLARQRALNKILQEGQGASFSASEKKHRRGRFPAVNVGVTYGNGATEAINLKNSNHDAMVQRLCADKDIQRMATFASGRQFIQPHGHGLTKDCQLHSNSGARKFMLILRSV